MSEQTIPEWAIERALDAVNAESRDSSLGSQYRQYGYADMVSPPVRTLARYIAEHEEPPVDPLQECLRETYGAAAPEFVSAFKASLEKRGLKVVEVRHGDR